MKALLIFTFFALSVCAEEDVLRKLSEGMKEAEQMLRDDRHDVFVRVKLKALDDQLDGMIKELEKQQSEQQKQNQQNQQQQQKQQAQRQNQNSASPLANSQLGPTVRPVEPQGPTAKVEKKADKWASLPPAARDELLQTYGSDVPVRWRKRIEAYFYSVATEEERDRRR